MTSRTTTLPLFPLSLVLFPGMALPLHIFEERYKRMISLCLREGRDFGVVLAGAGAGATGHPLTYPVGTTAHITGATRFPDGCINLTAIGEQRFRIHALDWDLAYCMAEVEWLTEPTADAEPLRARAARRWNAFRQQIADLTREAHTENDLSTHPTEASYALAAALPVNTTEKQALLEATDTAARLREIIRLINREHGVLNYLLEPHAEAIQPPDESEIYAN